MARIQVDSKYPNSVSLEWSYSLARTISYGFYQNSVYRVLEMLVVTCIRHLKSTLTVLSTKKPCLKPLNYVSIMSKSSRRSI